MKKTALKITSFFLVSLMMGCGAKKDEPKVAPTEIQATKTLFEYITEQNVDEIKKLANQDLANFNGYDEKGKTPLYRALQTKNVFLIEAVLDGGAKIYQPSKDNPQETSYAASKVIGSDIESMIEKESKRLSSTLAQIIEKEQFKEALEFSKENYLPKDLSLAGTENTAMDLLLPLSKPSNPDLVLYVKHLVSKDTPGEMNLETRAQEVSTIISKVQDTGIFVEVLDLYKNEGVDDETIIALNDEDVTNISWLTYKLSVLNERGKEIKISDLEKKFLWFNQEAGSKEDLKSYRNLITEYFKSQNEDPDKNTLSRTIVSLILDQAKLDVGLLSWVVEILKVRKKFVVEDPGYSLDEYTSKVIEAIKGSENIKALNLEEVFEEFSRFASNTEDNLDDTFKSIVSGDFRTNTDYLLRLTFSKTGALPEGILAFAIKNGGIGSAVSVVDAAGVRFNPSGQENSVLAAVQNSEDIFGTKSLIDYLNDKGISFDSVFAKDALITLLRRAWDSGDLKWNDVTKIILSESPRLFSKMEDEELKGVLKSFLVHVKTSKDAWDSGYEIFQYIPKVNRSPWTYDKRILDDRSEGYQVEVSFLWDYLLTAYDVFDEGFEESVEPMLLVFKRILERFPKETFTMSFMSSGQIEDLQLTHNILAMSILLSLGADKIKDSFQTLNMEEFEKHVFTLSNSLSWRALINNEFYSHYSRVRFFWVKVVKTLLKTEMTIPDPEGKVAIEFLRILSRNEAFKEYGSALIEKLEHWNISLEDHEKSCVLPKGPYNDFFRQKIGGPQQVEERQLSTYPKVWTSLGTFEALMPLKDKTCVEQKPLSLEEIGFINRFVANHLSEKLKNKITWQRTPFKEEACSNVNLLNETKFSEFYTPLGAHIGPKETTGATEQGVRTYDTASGYGVSESFQTCLVFDYEEDIHNLAKLHMLKSWRECAISGSDEELTNYFDSISEQYNLDIDTAPSKIQICRWAN